MNSNILSFFLVENNVDIDVKFSFLKLDTAYKVAVNI